MILLIFNAILALVMIIGLFNAKISGERGTNTVTRFVRDSASYGKFGRIVMYACIASIATVLIGLIFHCWWACIPTLCVVPVGIAFKIMSNRSTQRVEDSRTVTKVTTKAVSSAAAPVAVGAGLIAGAPVAGTLIAGAGIHYLGHAAGKAADEMTDVNVHTCTEGCVRDSIHAVSDWVNTIAVEMDEVRAAAIRMGISVEGKTDEEVTDKIVQFAPKAVLDQLPEDMPNDKKAMCIVRGAV